MSNGNNGDGDGYVPMTEFESHVITENAALQRINLALWGAEGTGGIVKDIHDLKNQSRLIERVTTFAVGIVSAAVTALILRYIAGG